MTKSSFSGQDRKERSTIDPQADSTSTHLPTPSFAKKELHVDHDHAPEKPLPPPLPRQTASREPGQSTRKPSITLQTSVPATPLLLDTSFPATTSHTPMSVADTSANGSMPTLSRRHRTRKVVTEEVQPTDSESVAILGMSPFMPGKDAIYNQNRLVRNEVILARHLSRLQKTYAASESTHAQRAQDFYRVISDHKSSIDLLKNAQAMSPIHLNPEFTALVDAHIETRKALEELTKDIASFSSSTRQSIQYLSDAVRRLTTPFPENSESTLDTSHLVPIMMSGDSFSSSPRPLQKAVYAGVKRKRSPSILSPSSGVPPTSQASTSAAHSALISRSNSIVNDSSREVIYGPIKDDADLSSPVTVGNEAIRNVGLSPSMVHSIRITSDRPEYLAIRFLKTEYALRFVDLVPFGDHPERQAFILDASN